MDNYITLTNLAFCAGVLKQIGRYNGKDTTLHQVKIWLKARDIDFNLDGICESDVLHPTPLTHLDTPNTICFIISASPYLITKGE